MSSRTCQPVWEIVGLPAYVRYCLWSIDWPLLHIRRRKMGVWLSLWCPSSCYPLPLPQLGAMSYRSRGAAASLLIKLGYRLRLPEGIAFLRVVPLLIELQRPQLVLNAL